MYLFSTEKSCAGCQPTDRFTLINAGYLGAVDTAFTEEGLTLGMGAFPQPFYSIQCVWLTCLPM